MGDTGTDAGTSVRERISEFLGDGSDRDIALARRIVVSFQAKARLVLGATLDAARQDDADAALLHAHTLKGMAANLGGQHLQTLCAQMESWATDGSLQQITEHSDSIANAIDDLAHLLHCVAQEFPTLRSRDPEPRQRETLTEPP